MCLCVGLKLRRISKCRSGCLKDVCVLLLLQVQEEEKQLQQLVSVQEMLVDGDEDSFAVRIC